MRFYQFQSLLMAALFSISVPSFAERGKGDGGPGQGGGGVGTRIPVKTESDREAAQIVARYSWDKIQECFLQSPRVDSKGCQSLTHEIGNANLTMDDLMSAQRSKENSLKQPSLPVGQTSSGTRAGVGKD